MTKKGLYCPAGDFYIDPMGAAERAVITHAHSDHARRGSQQYHIPSHFVVPLCIPADCLDLSVRCLHRNTFAYEA
jgi:hypothetical protein